jgi:hypothetical protein
MNSNESDQDADHERQQLTDESEEEFLLPSHRPRYVRLLLTLLLVLAIIVGGFFTVRTFSRSTSSLIATPTPALPPGANLVSIVTNPIWGTVSVDGHPVAHESKPGAMVLHLSRGVHHITWDAPPFPAQQCFIDVPPQSATGSGSCNTTNSSGTATIVSFTATSADLSQAQHAALISAVQAYAQSLQASTPVQPGELYASNQAQQGIATATQSLQATAHFLFDTNLNSTQSCFNIVPNSGQSTPSCSVNGVSCQTLCPTPVSDPNSLSAHPSWSVYVPVRITWSYTTSSGRLVAQHEPDETGKNGYEDLLPLYITWSGSTWQVTDQSGLPAPTLPDVTTNPLCMAALASLYGNKTLHSTTFHGQDATTNDYHFHAGANAVSGCLIKVALYNLKSTPIPTAPEAYLLYRFGVLLTANAATHGYWPNLPVADAYEQHLAQQLGAP